MNIIVAVLEREYRWFKTVKRKRKGKIVNVVKLKHFDEAMQSYYYDVNNRCSNLNLGDVIFFYMYGYCKYYAIVTNIQPNLLTVSCRIYFNEIFENTDWKGTQIKKFQGIKYIPDIAYDPEEEKGMVRK
jgi:hypothetical protein